MRYCLYILIVYAICYIRCILLSFLIADSLIWLQAATEAVMVLNKLYLSDRPQSLQNMTAGCVQ